MASYTEMTQKVGDQLIDALKRVEDAGASMTSSLSEALPDAPSLPGADRLPSPTEIITANFALFERLLQAQKDFALRLAGSSGSAGTTGSDTGSP